MSGLRLSGLRLSGLRRLLLRLVHVIRPNRGEPGDNASVMYRIVPNGKVATPEKGLN